MKKTNNKKRRINKKLYIIIPILLICFLYLSCKIFYAIKINDLINIYSNAEIKEDNINITILNDENYKDFKTIKIENIFDNWNTYNHNEEEKNISIGYKNSKDQLIYINTNIVDFVEEYSKIQYLKNTFEENEINSEKELLKYYFNHSRINTINLLSSLKNMINTYNIIGPISSSDYNVDKITIINNDFILFECNEKNETYKDLKTVSIYKDNKIVAIITFRGFSKNQIYDILDNIVVK